MANDDDYAPELSWQSIDNLVEWVKEGGGKRSKIFKRIKLGLVILGNSISALRIKEYGEIIRGENAERSHSDFVPLMEVVPFPLELVRYGPASVESGVAVTVIDNGLYHPIKEYITAAPTPLTFNFDTWEGFTTEVTPLFGTGIPSSIKSLYRYSFNFGSQVNKAYAVPFFEVGNGRSIYIPAPYGHTTSGGATGMQNLRSGCKINYFYMLNSLSLGSIVGGRSCLGRKLRTSI